MNRYEKRFASTAQHKPTVSRRAAETESDGKVIRGYAAVFFDADKPDETQYRLWDDILERVMPGAFDRAISEAHDARGLFNHDPSWLLGRVASGTVRLSVDSIGLRYEIDQNDTDPQWQSVAAKIDRGDVTGSSFGFLVTRATWTEETVGESRIWYRQIEDVELYDVSPVTWPAYTGTSAGRSDTDADRASLIAERSKQLFDFDAERLEINSRLMDMGLSPIL